MLSRFSGVRFFATLWTVACQSSQILSWRFDSALVYGEAEPFQRHNHHRRLSPSLLPTLCTLVLGPLPPSTSQDASLTSSSAPCSLCSFRCCLQIRMSQAATAVAMMAAMMPPMMPLWPLLGCVGCLCKKEDSGGSLQRKPHKALFPVPPHPPVTTCLPTTSPKGRGHSFYPLNPH